MHKVNPAIHEIITAKVLADAVEKEPSGRLSASRLGWPLQWQMLHHFKVPQKPIDEYTLRKFQRGKDVEERIMKWLAPAEDKMQIPVEYRGVAGVMDVLLEYPWEVKSVTNRAFPFKQKEGISRGHQLQCELYCKAKGFDTGGVLYVASDDYRTLGFEFKVSDEVDKIIDRYEAQVKLGTVPVFEELEKWHGMEEYNPYPDWMKLSEEAIATKLEAMGVVVPMRLPLNNQ